MSAGVPRLFLWLSFLSVVGVLVPLLYLFLRALEADPAMLGQILLRERNLTLLFNTLTLATTVLIGSSLIALPLAFLAARAKVRYPGLLVLVGVLPLAIPGYVGAYAFLSASGLGGLIDRLTGLNWPAPGGFWGAAGVFTLFNFPYLFLNFWATLRYSDPATEEAARLLGLSRWATFRRVTLPALRPAWYAGGLLILLHVLGDFGTVSLMRFETFSYAIYQQYNALFDRTYAAWLSLLVVMLTLIIVALEAQLMRRVRLARVGTGTARKMQRTALSGWTFPALGFVLLVFSASVVIPLASMLYWLIQSKIQESALSGWLESLFNSLELALPAALLTTFLALAPAYLGVRFPSRMSRILERLGYLGYAIPPLAFALAFVFFSLKVVPDLYQTVPLLIFAYALHFLVEAIGPIRSSLLSASARIEEAARLLGLSPVKAFLKATLPLLRPGLLASLALVFVSVLKELPLAFLLTPIGFDTLAKDAWGYSSEAMFAEAAPFALSLVVVSLVFVRILWQQEGKK